VGVQKNVIEINGKKYDATTGKLVDNARTPMKASLRPAQNIGSIDGFSRKKPTTVNAITKPSKISPARRQAVHATKPVQKSQTLMRSAVKKPVPKTIQQPVSSDKKISSLGLSPHRFEAAKNTPTNTQVYRYGAQPQHSNSVVMKLQPLTVKKEEEVLTHAVPATKVFIQQKPHMSAAAKMIEKSLASATAHEHPQHEAPKKHRKFAHKLGISARTMAISSTVLAGVLLGGFFAVQNVPNLSMRVAAARAGFDANMPGYNPSGFSFKGPINYSPGQVTVSFRSNTDSRNYDVTQRASNWNSDALLANYIIEEDKQYQTYLDRGRTLFIYDGSNATWVDNGVWYQIEGESDMTTDQLVRVADSI
jgi:hypothetical protein